MKLEFSAPESLGWEERKTMKASKFLDAQNLDTDRLIRTNARLTEVGRRLMEISGVGPLLAS
ncbi:hypothetical protein GCM10017643_02660 [Ancylobacter dichloromethanicus]|uniref:Uncharacterized protein n=1 Tax=Ancylobacter dichloromethanicus TaxID=518825 RepID=A0A9W6MXL2_9HYPH|nr:hypothetical protein GCM10017643_02660 [Ancylobacter dichloromethanicus]